MPPIDTPIQPLTPRIEYTDERGYFSNLYDSGAHIRVLEDGDRQRVEVSGEMCDEKVLPGGVAYRIIYDFGRDEVAKHIELRFHSRTPAIAIVEPIVLNEGVSVQRVDALTARILGGSRPVRFTVAGEGIDLAVGESAGQYWHLFPGIRAYPLSARVVPAPETWLRSITVRYEVESP